MVDERYGSLELRWLYVTPIDEAFVTLSCGNDDVFLLLDHFWIIFENRIQAVLGPAFVGVELAPGINEAFMKVTHLVTVFFQPNQVL